MNTFTLGLIVIAYLLSLAYLGFLGYKKTTSASDYLVGGRQMNPFVMALSYGATFISASAIVGFGGVAAAFGMGIQWLCFLNMFIGVVIAFIFFGLRTRRMGARLNVSTFPQLLGRHYRSRGIQVFVAAVIFLGMPLYAAVVMKGGAVFIEQIFQIDFNVSLLIFTLVIAAYVIAGGMKGGMYTEALQAVIMFGCMLFLLFSLYRVLDMGFTEANQALTDIAPLVPEKFKALGHQGWTAMPVTGSPQWYTLVTSLILGVGIGCLAQPQLVVRFMTVESSKQLNRGVFIGCFFLIITVGAIYHAGALSNLFFLKTEGVVATEAVKETVEKTTVKASEVIEEAKDAAADIAKAPVVEEAKETVKKAVKEVAKNIDIKKFAETTIELPGFAVAMSSIEEAIKKDIKDKGIEGKEISVYVNVEQKAAYYTVDGQGSDDYRIDLNTL